jgi:hypothetical protein
VKRVDAPVFPSSTLVYSPLFPEPRVLVDYPYEFYRLCYPTSGAMIAFFVNPFKYLIDEIILIGFLPLR